MAAKRSDGFADPRDGLALCVLHQRMFGASVFTIDPGTLTVKAHPNYTPEDMRITRPGIDHLKERPHAGALESRWKHHPLPKEA